MEVIIVNVDLTVKRGKINEMRKKNNELSILDGNQTFSTIAYLLFLTF